MTSSVASILKAIRTGKTTSVDVVNKCIRYIERYISDILNIFICEILKLFLWAGIMKVSTLW